MFRSVSTMPTANKIGLGVITCDRPAGLQKALTSLPWERLDRVVVVNDGAPVSSEIFREAGHGRAELLQNERNLGVAKSKNRALRHLLQAGMDHLFLMEDDIFVKDGRVFEQYVEAVRITGIQHLNFSQHGPNNKDPKGKADPVTAVDYGPLRIALHRHCVGAFSYYSRGCLEVAGLMDEDFYNAGEHLEHTYRILRAGFHPPFWFFADVDRSEELLGEEPWSVSQSRIASRADQAELVRRSDALFQAKHGHPVGSIPIIGKEVLMGALEKIQGRFGKKGGISLRATGSWPAQLRRRNLWDKLRDRLRKGWSSTSR
jgi:glycosyltransferase involved in cell wall biosynthesis